MANLKRMDEGSLVASIEEAKAYAHEQIDRAVEAARSQVQQVALAFKEVGASPLFELAVAADVALLGEMRVPQYVRGGPFYLQMGGLTLTELGQADVEVGRYRVLLIAQRIGDT